MNFAVAGPWAAHWLVQATETGRLVTAIEGNSGQGTDELDFFRVGVRVKCEVGVANDPQSGQSARAAFSLAIATLQ